MFDRVPKSLLIIGFFIWMPLFCAYLVIKHAHDILRALLIMNLKRLGWASPLAAEEMARLHGKKAGASEGALYRKDGDLRRAFDNGNRETSQEAFLAAQPPEIRQALERHDVETVRGRQA